MKSTCIDVLVIRVGDALSLVCRRLGISLRLPVKRKGTAINVEASRVGHLMPVKAERNGKALSFRCGLVCSVASAYYLRVPVESIWLLPENDFSQDVVVYANVNWTIK